MSYTVYGLRKQMSKFLDKDVRVKGHLLYLYECPPEVRKCNEDADAKAKKEKRKAAKGALPTPAAPPEGGCRPCEQPHFFISDSPNGKLERALLVADYPIKDWKTGRPKPLTVKQGEVLHGDRHLRHQLDDRLRRLERPARSTSGSRTPRARSSPRATPCCRPRPRPSSWKASRPRSWPAPPSRPAGHQAAIASPARSWWRPVGAHDRLPGALGAR